MTIKRLLGSAPSQVSTNKNLGGMAFQDAADVTQVNVQQTTNTTNEGPSLLLDFANSKTLDPRITFSRPTTATYYNGVTTALAEQNLLTYSTTFNATYWTALNATNTLSQTDPNGGTTACLFTPTAQYGGLFIPTSALPVNGTTYTISFWAKAGTSTNTLQVFANGPNVSYGSYTPTSTWTQYTFTFTPSGTAVSGFFIAQDRNASGFGSTFLAFPQLEQRASATAYNATTTTALTNYIPALQTAASGVARFDCNPTTGESLGLLIEEQRINLILQSAFASGWTYTTATGTLASDIAPDGTQTAILLTEDTSTGEHRVYQGPTTTAVATTASVYAKANSRTWLSIRIQDSGGASRYAFFNLANGTLGTVQTNLTATITSVGNGWYRCSASVSTAFAGTNNIVFNLCSADATYSYAGNGWGSVYLWGAQLEAGTFPTSYISTVASQVTRSQDYAYVGGNIVSANNGTLYAKFSQIQNVIPSYAILGSGVGPWTSYFRNIGSNIWGWGDSTSDRYALPFIPSPTYQAAIAWNSSTLTVTGTINSVNPVVTGFSGSFSSSPTVNNLYLMCFGNSANPIGNGWLKKVTYFPIALSSAELQEMTA